MRIRLRERSDVDYQVARSNGDWTDHVLRTLVTAAHIAWFKPDTVLDIACGDGSITKAAMRLVDIPHPLFVDIGHENVRRLAADGYVSKQGDALDFLSEQPGDFWDVVVLTEFLEHVEDPDAVLREARRVGRHLVASSPQMRPMQVDHNPEHLWMFDDQGYLDMVQAAGWTATEYTKLTFPEMMYDFQVWTAD